MKSLAALAAWCLAVCLGAYAWLLRRAALEAADLAVKQGVLKVMLFYGSLSCIALAVFLGLGRERLRLLVFVPAVIVVAAGWEIQRIWTDAFP